MPADHTHLSSGIDPGVAGRPEHTVHRNVRSDPPTSQTSSNSISPKHVIAAPAHLGVYSQAKFRTAAAALIDMTTPQTGRLVIDFSQVETIDSAGLNVLILLQRRAARRRVQVVLQGLCDDHRALLELTKLTDLFHFRDGDAR